MRSRKNVIYVYLSDNEKNHLDKQIKNTGVSMSTFIRKLIMGETIQPRPPEEYIGLVRAINAIGSNINQIAYIANVTKNISLQEIEDIKKMQNDIVRLMRALG